MSDKLVLAINDEVILEDETEEISFEKGIKSERDIPN